MVRCEWRRWFDNWFAMPNRNQAREDLDEQVANRRSLFQMATAYASGCGEQEEAKRLWKAGLEHWNAEQHKEATASVWTTNESRGTGPRERAPSRVARSGRRGLEFLKMLMELLM